MYTDKTVANGNKGKLVFMGRNSDKRGDSGKILIVDDVPVNLKLLAGILAKEGYEVLEAGNGDSALALAAEHRPCLVLLDIMMPEMDGFEVCAALRKEPATRNVGVIFVSVQDSIADKVKGFELGAIDFITKPYNNTEVLARVRTHYESEMNRRRLRQTREDYATLVETIQDGVAIWTPGDGAMFVNSALAAAVGVDKVKIIERGLFTIFDGEDGAKAAELARKVYDVDELTPRSECVDELKIRTAKAAGGIVRHAECFFSKINYSGRAAVLVSVRDLTERIAIERRLSQSQRLESLGLLTSGISHDFNNVLAIINGYTELAMLDLPEDSPAREKLGLVLSAGRSAVGVTKGLLAFGRVKDLSLKPVDLRKETENAGMFLRKGLPAKVNFTLDLPDGPLVVMADSGQLQQVLVNLCLNARDAMARGGSLRVSLSKETLAPPPHAVCSNDGATEFALLRVADTGGGIPEDLVERIFDPFFTTKDKGSGLGLPMLARIVRSHKGWVDLSNEPGKGATFNVYIPLAPDAALVEATAPGSRLNPAFKRVLVVEDDRIQARMIQHFLEREGYEVETAIEAKSAMRFLGESPGEFGLLVVDQVIPGVPGSELVRQARDKWPAIKVLMVTGAGDTPMCGDQLLRKPFTIDDFFAALAKL